MKKILILNTGGTFSKLYNPLNGELVVPKNNKAIENILSASNIEGVAIDGIIYKDSLEITKKDREDLVKYINNCNYKNILIVHGTDTIDKTALFLDKYIKNKTIVLTGAMRPFSIEPIEATSNLMCGYGALTSDLKKGIYISMHGLVKKFKKIKKNRELGIFECH